MLKALSVKTLIAAGALATAIGLAVPAPAARADVSIGIGFGVYPAPPAAVGWGGGYDGGYDGGGYGGGYGGYGGGYGSYGDGYYGGYGGGYQRPPYPGYGGWVSCRDGRRILWRSGYQDIEVQSCRRGTYRYTAWRHGRQYLMAVDARGGVARLQRIH